LAETDSSNRSQHAEVRKVRLEVRFDEGRLVTGYRWLRNVVHELLSRMADEDDDDVDNDVSGDAADYVVQGSTQ
jgi:hypothetical protein